jgi:hypothetical protein
MPTTLNFLRLATLALSLITASTTAQSDCGDFVPEGEIALGTSLQCGIGGVTPSGLSGPDCGVQTVDILGPGAVSLSYAEADGICNDEEWSDGWVVGCDSEDNPTLVVLNDSEYYTCYEAPGACQVSFGGFSTGYYGKSHNCKLGA